MNVRALAASAALLSLLVRMPGASAAQKAPGFEFLDWQVSTSEFETNYSVGTFSAPSHITLTRPGSEIQADRAEGNFKSKQATLSGGVILHDDNGLLTNFAGGATGSNKPATLTCDSLQIDGVDKIYTAIGRVHFSQGTSSASADRAIMNGITHDLHLFGHVVLHQ